MNAWLGRRWMCLAGGEGWLAPHQTEDHIQGFCMLVRTACIVTCKLLRDCLVVEETNGSE